MSEIMPKIIICSECHIVILNDEKTIFSGNFEIIKMMHQCLECNKIYCHNCKKPESQLCYYCK